MDEDVDTLIRRAVAGDGAAQHDLAQELHFGRTLPCDFAAALYWYEEAARSRPPAWELAAESAARFHRDGLATPIDWARSLVLFEDAARVYSYARLDVAWAYYWGLGTPRDPAKAAGLYEDMYTRYQITDFTALAALHALGAGVPKDMSRCVDWLRLARDPCGQLLAGHALHTTDPDKAGLVAQFWEHWLAAWSGDAHAQFVLSKALKRGDDKVPDLATRMRWMRLAADAGHAEAQYWMAENYYRHSGSSLAARELAWYWMGRAAAQGNEDAMRELARIGNGPG